MSVHIAFVNPPEFYTNLDTIYGKVILGVNRPEQIGAVIVKLEGESKTALGIPDGDPDGSIHPPVRRRPSNTESSQLLHENHKVLYRVRQVFPDESVPAYSVPVTLNPGQHEWDFQFKIPFNNACGDPKAMAKIGGLAGAGGFAGPSFFGMGGIRLMDGSKQLFYKHVTKTLPPSFTGFPRQAEIRYYVKVTIQRPGIFKENWRNQLGFKFLPIEPPRAPATNQEAYAKRPFAFKPKTPALGGPSPSTPQSNRSSIFSRKPSIATLGSRAAPADNDQPPPSIEVSARLPHPTILTCNKSVPLRLISKKLGASRGECYLVSVQIDLVGSTVVRCQDLLNTEISRWVVVARHGLAIPLQKGPDDAVGTEIEVPDIIWKNKPLPNTVMPSFLTCNLRRSYALEIKLGVNWGKPAGTTAAIPDELSASNSKSSSFSLKVKGKGKARNPDPDTSQTMFLPLHFSTVQIYSGLTPPESLAQVALKARQEQTHNQTQTQIQQPRPPPRPNGAASSQAAPALPPRQSDPLYPPQLRPGQIPGQASTASGPATGGGNINGPSIDGGTAPPYDEAPPSYDEAMAEVIEPGPVVSNQARPAYSGVTNENAPDSLPEKGS